MTSQTDAMLASQLNHLMEEIDPLCIVQADKFMCNRMQGDKRVIILLDVKILKKGSDIGHKLGNPQPLKADGPASTEPSVHNSSAAIQDMNRPAQRPPLNPSSTFTSGSNTPTPTLQTSKSFGGKGAPTGPSTPGTPGSNRVHPINSLTPYQNRWRIRARVTQKSSIRTWSNSRGEGRLFNVNFLDESGEIRATGFNEAVDKFYDMLEVNKVYYVSKGSLKTANKQYSNLKNDYEMSLNNDTIIEPCSENVDLPTMNFDFVPINQMEKHAPNSVIDVVGVVKVCNDVSTVVGRQTQKEITKRDLQIVDQSGVAINLTLWGDEAVKFNGNGHPVIAVKGAKLSDFGGRSLSVLASSQLILNPDVREAHFLRGWYDREGAAMDFSSFRGEGTSGSGSGTNWKIFEQAKRENLGQGDKPDYFTSKATVIFMKKDNCMYKACPTENCNKKMIDQGNGMYRCEKCQREFPNYKWRMILSANLADFSDNQWITSFQESAEAMLGIKADDLGNLRESNETAFDEVFQRAVFKQYIFRLRAKVETYNEENRLKTVCMTATPINYVEYGNHLVEQLKSFIH
ncbi:hypothetical protein C0Q70_07094 [Pomacea canaliculata]|uniref:Replication protein A subunit n=1 Tax=Pomacea canaliculata TaxID=400727 RepID=A0A2T7PE32_POMCA|nr:hypothetical protein C0Q70_07094 [Pomacea canaliculata]